MWIELGFWILTLWISYRVGFKRGKNWWWDNHCGEEYEECSGEVQND